MKLYIIDGSSFLYRAYYGLKPLTAPDGSQVQAIFGFCRMIKKIIKDFHPDHAVLVWDSAGRTARHELYTEYKATRQDAPSDIFKQKEIIQHFADMIKLKQLAQESVEADDLMATMAQQAAQDGHEVVIISSDKDMRQIVNERITIFDPFQDLFLTQSLLETKYGFPLSKLPFYFGLIGDASDNIPGVAGIGPKGAEKLVKQFESLEDLYAHINEAGTPRTQQLLLANKDNAFLSEKLFTLQQVPLIITPAECAFNETDFAEAAPLFEKLNFSSLLKEIGKPAPNAPASTNQTFAERYGYTFITVNTPELLENLRQEIVRVQAFAFDTEGDNLDVFTSNLVGLSFCCQKGIAYYVPFGHETGEQQLSKEDVFKALAPLLEDKNIKKYMHHAKYDQMAMLMADVKMQGLAFDTLIAADLVPSSPEKLGLKTLSQHYLHETMFSFADMVTSKKLNHFGQVPLTNATDYSAADAHQTWQLTELLKKQLREHAQEKLYYELELPLIDVLMDMERQGILLDTHTLSEVNKLVSHELELIIQEIANAAGVDRSSINLNSPQQVGVLLFETLGLPPVKKTAKKTGYSTDQEVLSTLALRHPVPALILRYRELFKLKSTYIDALPTYINKKTGHIHTNFKQTSVATGRLASSDPNLQNIPSESGTLSIRAAFKADPEQLFISADYSQIELRVLAHLSKDENLVNAFLQGQDIHTKTATGLFNIPAEQVNHEQRQMAKRINFSILYGLTPFGLAKELHISQTQAKEYIEAYMSHYPGVQAWMQSVIEETKRTGYTTTWYGRRRYVPEIHEKNHTLFQLGCRIAVNTVVQGTAAEIMKLGMLKTREYLSTFYPESHILLQIHDELLISAPEAMAHQVAHSIQNTLQTVVDWDVPLVVSVRQGKTWHDVSK